jgi:hypothetical protein
MDMSPNRRECLSRLFSFCVSNDLKQPVEPKENIHILNDISLTLFPVHLLREPLVLFSVCSMRFLLATACSHKQVTTAPFCAKSWQLAHLAVLLASHPQYAPVSTAAGALGSCTVALTFPPLLTFLAQYHVSCHEVQSTGQEQHDLLSALLTCRESSIAQVYDREQTHIL